MSGENKKSKKKIILIIFIILIIILGSIIYNYYEIKNIDIKEVKIQPNNITSDDIIKIDLILDGASSPVKPRLDLVYFYNGYTSAENQNMDRRNDNEYSINIGPFNEGTRIWLVISITVFNEVIIYEDTINVGEINNSEIVSISNINYIPTDLKKCSELEISAEFSIKGVITEMNLMWGVYFVYYPNGLKSSGALTPDYKMDSSMRFEKYYFEIASESKYFTSDTKILYRFYYGGENYSYITPAKTLTIP